MSKMLILPGVARSGGAHDPRGLLDRDSASEFARLSGYTPMVLDISGETGSNSAQVRAAAGLVTSNPDIRALYGFSGGGYNVRHLLRRLSQTERGRIERVIVIGAPGNDPGDYSPTLYPGGSWTVTYRGDPPGPSGHMRGPAVLLAELRRITPPTAPTASPEPAWRRFWRWLVS